MSAAGHGMPLRGLKRLVATSFLVAVLAAPASAQVRHSSLDPARVDFVLGSFQFTLLHELAHVAIAELEVPVLGPEEMAADYLATLALIQPPRPSAFAAAQRHGFAVTAADAFLVIWQLAESQGVSPPYWDVHGLSIQRFYTIACLLYGSDPERFEAIPGLARMPLPRAESCPEEYARARRSLDWLLSFAGQDDGEQPRATMSVRYEPPHSRTSAGITDEIRGIELVERTLRGFAETVPLEEDAVLVLRSCGIPEAAWNPDSRELVFCYELLDMYYLLSAERHRGAIETLRQEDR
jgi:hypothetical protein